jgi:hypothetical protein
MIDGAIYLYLYHVMLFVGLQGGYSLDLVDAGILTAVSGTWSSLLMYHGYHSLVSLIDQRIDGKLGGELYGYLKR